MLKMKKLKVYDPAMCCSTGVCGPAVKPELVQFANDLASLKERGIFIERFNLGQQPAAFAQKAEVRSLLGSEGTGCLPIIMLDDKVAIKGIYPTHNQLAKLVGLDETSSCGCESNGGCESSTERSNQSNIRKIVEIDFLYLDLQVCTRCKGTDANLMIALDTVQSVLQAAGIETVVKKTLIDSEEKAMELGFVSSPTIRVNGLDIALQLQESNCSSCGEASGALGEIDCRVWAYRGEEYTEAPVPMIVDAILSAVYGAQEAVPSAAPERDKEVPENLKRFFAAKAAKQQSECCSSAEQTADFDADENSPCCASETTSCGCGNE